MPKQFNGVISVDIRESEPDWTPFEAPSISIGQVRDVLRAAGADGTL
jgi:hypothetical protein